MIMEILKDISKAVFPPICVVCRAPCKGHDHLCKTCLNDIKRADSNAKKGKIIWFYKFEGTVAALFKLAKIAGDRPALEALKKLWSEAAVCLKLPEDTVITAVPAHPADLAGRGFDAAAALARELSKQTSLPFEPRLLKKIRRTKQQKTLSKEERAENIKKAFSADAGKLPPKTRHIVIIDDVYTTGSTLIECQKTLKTSFPTLSVSCIAMAHVTGHCPNADTDKSKYLLAQKPTCR